MSVLFCVCRQAMKITRYRMHLDEIKKTCTDCGKEFVISESQQKFFRSRGWEIPKRCKNCRDKKKQEWKKKEAEVAMCQLKKELADSPYEIKRISEIEINSPSTTLYVIGNGFDLAHGVPSSYSKFRDWLGKYSDLRETLEDYIKSDALWWNFEEALADIDLNTPFLALPEMMDTFEAYDPDGQMADYFMAIDMAMQPVDTITNELPKKFRKWIESLKVDATMKPLNNIVKPGASYLNFNYTEFLEKIYGVSDVCYIHGNRQKRKDKLILGHFYKTDVSDVSVKMPSFRDDYKKEMINAAFNDALVHTSWYDEETTKNSYQIIKDHESFFAGLCDIDTVVVIGHSLSEVDMEYFEKIHGIIHRDAQWIFSCHNIDGLKSINSFTKRMDIEEDKVTIFSL